MKKTTRSGLIVLILMLIGMGLYTAYTIFRMNGGRLFRSINATETFRVAEDSDAYDSTTAKEYKNNFIAALYIEGTIAEANQSYSGG